MIVWTYVITYDENTAPNFEPPAATLTVCKPDIRRLADQGHLVLAFNGKRLHPEPHSVRCAGIVSEVIPLARYWHDSRFKEKKPGNSLTPDNIYRPAARRLVQVPNSTHGQDSVRRDVGGL